MRGGAPFTFRGVTYGTFRPDANGDPYPARETVRKDFASIRENGFTVVRTYAEPPDHVLEAAAENGLQLLVGVFWRDWRYVLGGSSRQYRAVEHDAEEAVQRAAARLSGHEQVLGLCLGNEVPADVIRWVGKSKVSRTISHLAACVREVDDQQLVTYGNYPTAEYLDVAELDFVTFNVFLDRQRDLRRYITRLHHLAAGRPLVLGEIGAHFPASMGGDEAQAHALDWQLRTALEGGVAGTCVFSWTDDWWVGGERVDGWHFGLTRADRSPRLALEVARRWNRRTVADLDVTWPSLSVVICAYNASSTLEECLRHTCALEYPGLEIIVVDDGSTDETATIAAAHPRVRVLSIPHAGLSAARNEGYRAATGELVAYLDSDAYPSPQWPYYLALAMNGARVGAGGGPNLPPSTDPLGAQRVARAPGGPVHVLVGDDRAEHVPGCNMVFRRKVLEDLGGFDATFVTAGDDVDLCWRLLDRGLEIGFHPGAFVWHHPRASERRYLRQQYNYGWSESLVETRHPDRFTRLGSARWRGSIYGVGGSAASSFRRKRIYRGPFGTAAYQSVYGAGGRGVALAHQLGVPVSLALFATAPLAFVVPYLAAPALVAVVGLLALGCFDAFQCTPPPRLRRGRIVFRIRVALLHLVQPLVRLAGRHSRRGAVKPAQQGGWYPPQPTRRIGRATVIVPEDRPRVKLISALLNELAASPMRASPATSWDAHDIHLLGSFLLTAHLVSSSHPPGWVQIKLRTGLRWWLVAPLAVACVVIACVQPIAALAILSVAGVEALVGHRRMVRSFLRAFSETAL
jgi:glycosyltransferase involved in cell wall biosynthesis